MTESRPETHQRTFHHAANPEFSCSENVILLPFGRRSYLPAIVDACDGEPVELDETTDRELYTLHHDGRDLTLVYSGMGAPACANALEMVRRNGARRVVVFGACGGIVPGLPVGSLVAATGAVRGEGTSRWYAPPEFPAVFDPRLTVALADAGGRRHEVHTGVVFTTDAGYRQGPSIYETYRDLAIAVECECAAAAVVSARLGLAAGALLFCTDNVTLPKTGDQHYRGLADPRVQAAFESGLESCLEVLTTEED
ncbi:MAG: hypothetical protein ABFS37_05385 [Acidobacteriota bacterium]